MADSGSIETDLAARVTRSKGELAAEALEGLIIATVALEHARGPNAVASLAYLLGLEAQKGEARADLIKALSALQSRPVLRVV